MPYFDILEAGASARDAYAKQADLEEKTIQSTGPALAHGVTSFGPLVCAKQSCGDCPVEPCASECAYFSVVAARDGGRHE